jgi:hypothetical protein
VVVVAIVSGQPLELDRLRDSSGGWAEGALREVMLAPVGSYVGERLGRLVSRPGQQFSTDYRVVAGGSSSPLYLSAYYPGCAYGVFGTEYRRLTAACDDTYLWDAPGAGVRRPSELFPGDTALLFTTRRAAMRRPGGATIGTPQAFPAGGERGNGIPDLSRSGATASRDGDKGASAPAPPRGETRSANAKPSPTPAPPRRGSGG